MDGWIIRPVVCGPAAVAETVSDIYSVKSHQHTLVFLKYDALWAGMSNSSVFAYTALMYMPVIIYNRAEWVHMYEHICVDSNNSWGLC